MLVEDENDIMNQQLNSSVLAIWEPNSFSSCSHRLVMCQKDKTRKTRFKTESISKTNTCAIFFKQRSLKNKNILAMSTLIFIILTFMVPHASGVKVCGSALIDVLRHICADRGIYSPQRTKFRGFQWMRSRAQSREYRPVSRNCCQRDCTISDLKRYCNKDARTTSFPSYPTIRPNMPPTIATIHHSVDAIPTVPSRFRLPSPPLPVTSIPDRKKTSRHHHNRPPGVATPPSTPSSQFVTDKSLRHVTSEDLHQRYRNLTSGNSGIRIYEILKISAELGSRRRRHYTIRPTTEEVIYTGQIEIRIRDGPVEH